MNAKRAPAVLNRMAAFCTAIVKWVALDGSGEGGLHGAPGAGAGG
jgi:hypothetical protein